jgi:hypothetical protein
MCDVINEDSSKCACCGASNPACRVGKDLILLVCSECERRMTISVLARVWEREYGHYFDRVLRRLGV